MDIRIFEKTPQIAPLLVRLYESQKLYALAQDKQPQAQLELTAAVAALLEVDLSGREQELLTDVLIALSRQAEKDLRQALSERLSVMPQVPLRLALHFANDEIDVARPVLRKSQALSDLDLVYIIRSQGAEYWQAIAARHRLSPHIIDVLADTKDPGTALALTENDRVTLTTHALSILTDMAKRDEELARPLLSRQELPDTLARSLYKHVGQELKSQIRTNYGVTDETLDIAMEDIVLEFSESPQSEYMPTAQMIDVAERMASHGLLNINIMLDNLHRGQIANFIALFSRYTGLSITRIHDFLKQPCPKGLAIACRAFGIPKSDFARIFLLTNRMRAKDKIVNHHDMMEVLDYYSKVKSHVAQRIVMREAQ